MDSAVQHCGGPKGTVNGRLLDAQKQIRMHPHSHASRSLVLRGSLSYEFQEKRNFNELAGVVA